MPNLHRYAAQLGVCTLVIAGCSGDQVTDAQSLRAKNPDRESSVGVAQEADGSSAPAPKVMQVGGTPPVEERIRGQVIHPDGRSLGGASVTLFRRIREWPRGDREEVDSVLSGKDGRFVFPVPQGRGMEVEVSARGCATLVREAIAPGRRSLVLKLQPGFEVEGRVLLQNGRHAVDCAVYLEPGPGSEMLARETRTDNFGQFKFRGVPADSLRITARHDRYHPVGASPVTIGRPVTLQFEETRLGVAGNVRSVDSSKPVAGAEVLVYPKLRNGLRFVPYRVVTDNGGGFTVLGLGRGRYSVEIRHPDHSSMERVMNLYRSQTGLEFELQSRVRVRGKLVGLEDSAEETCVSLVSFFGERATASVRADGSFDFDAEYPNGLSRGLATFELESESYSFEMSKSRWIRDNLNDSTGDFELAVQPASVVAGRVTSPDGKPIPGVNVYYAQSLIGEPWKVLSDPTVLATHRRILAVTDHTGVYTIRGLEPGEVNLEFQKEQFADIQKLARVRSAKTEDEKVAQTVQLREPGSISGRVLRSGLPIMGALVSAAKGVSRGFTDPGGRFTLTGLPPGEHIVRVKFRTLPVTHSEEPIKVVAGRATEGVDIPLPTGRQIQGRVVDMEEDPMGDVLVESPGGNTARTAPSGKFEIEVPFGRTALVVRTSPFDPSFDRVTVLPGQRNILVRLREAPRAILKAIVRAMPQDTPVEGMILRLDSERGELSLSINPNQAFLTEILKVGTRMQKLNQHHVRGHVERWIDAPGGVVTLSNLPSGTYTMTLQAKGHQPFVKRVVLRNEEIEDLGNVNLQPGFAVHGVVINPAGKAVKNAKVVLGRESDLSLSGARTYTLTDANGRFTMHGSGLRLRELFVAAKGLATQRYLIDLKKDILRTEDDPMVVQMHQGATIKARLVDRDGESIPFRMIQLNRGYERIAEAETDEEGIAWFHNVSVGQYHLYLLHRLRTVTRLDVKDMTGAKAYEAKIKDSRAQRGPRQRQRRRR